MTEHIRIHDEGSIVMLEALTPYAREWLDENLDPDGIEWCGRKVVEWRYLEPILEGFAESLRESSL